MTKDMIGLFQNPERCRFRAVQNLDYNMTLLCISMNWKLCQCV